MNSLATFVAVLSLLAQSQGENKKRGVYGESLGFDHGISLASGLTYQPVNTPGVLIGGVSDAYGLPPSGLVYGNGYGYGYGYDNLVGNNVGSVVSKHVTVTNKVAVPVPQPYPVPVTKTVAVPVPQPVQVPVDRPYPVHIPQPIAVPVEKPYPVTVDRPYPVPVPQPYPVRVYRPVAVAVPKPVGVPVVNSQQTYAVRKTIPVYESDPSAASLGTYGLSHGLASFNGLTDVYSPEHGSISTGTGLSSFASGISAGWSSDDSTSLVHQPW